MTGFYSLLLRNYKQLYLVPVYVLCEFVRLVIENDDVSTDSDWPKNAVYSHLFLLDGMLPGSTSMPVQNQHSQAAIS